MAEQPYPFLFLNHGTIQEIDQLETAEEMYIWFQRPVNPEQRQDIEEGCPAPVAGFFRWAEEFIHFGSVDDSYDWGIYYEYTSPEEVSILEDFEYVGNEKQRAIQLKALLLFSEHLTRWIKAVHQIVPVAFFIGPGQVTPSKWNDWSYEQVATQALPVVERYLKKHPEFATIIHEEVTLGNGEETEIIIVDVEREEDNADEDQEDFERYFDYLEEEGYGYLGGHTGSKEMRNKEIATILPFILSELLEACIYTYRPKNDRERARILAFIEVLFDLDNIHEAVHSLSYERTLIDVNAQYIKTLLSGLRAHKKKQWLAQLKPYTQLAYYASYAANKGTPPDLFHHSRPLAKLQECLERIPRNRNGAIPSLLTNLAYHLVKVAPIYEEKEKTPRHALLAGQVMSLAFAASKEGGTSLAEEDYTQAASFYEMASDYGSMLEVSLSGYQIHSYSPAIVANIIYAAYQVGDEALAQTYSQRSEELSVQDERLLLNQTFILITNAQYAKAIRLIEAYEKEDHLLSPALYIHLLQALVFERPNAKQHIEKLLVLYRQPTAGKTYTTNAALTNKFVYLLNEEKCHSTAWEILEIFRNAQGYMEASLYCAALYTSLCLQNISLLSLLLKEVVGIFEKSAQFFDTELATYHNIAAAYAFLGDKRKISFLLGKPYKLDSLSC
ncbi:MAG: hypothetical protein AAF734_03205, partial [Bacteroidota bacterium]